MIATTIINSMSVKPRDRFSFVRAIPFSLWGHLHQRRSNPNAPPS
jgi:hypothetical protein